MLESEEVDDDYFTPVAKTSLASIFKKPVSGEKSENETLKYTPPVPKPTLNHQNPPKTYENIFSCVFDAYLWVDNIYTHKGKLGCAVVKHKAADEPQNFHSILLYDSKRATVSSAVATNTLQVTVKGDNVISYYDRYGKYWYLRGTEEDVKKIIYALKTCNVNVKVFNEDDNTVPEHNQDKDIITETSKGVIESDTDSSINRKTKASILNRMASMGQSVLPPRAVSIEQTSDSDTNEDQIITVRHKPVKNIAKKTVSEQQKPDVQKAIVPIVQSNDNKTLMGIDNQIQLQSSTFTPFATTSGQDLNYYFTEQRISNSELRINMTRITDKVDSILDKVNNMEKDKNVGSTINTIIFQKLLQEYESKIKTYEELLQKVNKNTNISKEDFSTDMVETIELVSNLNNKISELDNCIVQKDSELSVLNNEIIKLKEINDSINSRQTIIQKEYETKIVEYEESNQKNNEMLSKLSTENDELLKSHNDQIQHKIKSIMNETFHAIENNFDENETYSGETIKNIVGTVIKKVTIESLRKLK